MTGWSRPCASVPRIAESGGRVPDRRIAMLRIHRFGSGIAPMKDPPGSGTMALIARSPATRSGASRAISVPTTPPAECATRVKRPVGTEAIAASA